MIIRSDSFTILLLCLCLFNCWSGPFLVVLYYHNFFHFCDSSLRLLKLYPISIPNPTINKNLESKDSRFFQGGMPLFLLEVFKQNIVF